MKAIEELVRPELLQLKPYSSARDEFVGEAEVYIDANENPFNNEMNRYPDPLQVDVKKRLAEIKDVSQEYLFLGNGSDEVLDLIMRLFCIPGKDNVIITPPTYGMYKVLAGVNNIFVREVALKQNFQIDSELILENSDAETKILFLCSPNNPVGISLNREDVEQIITAFPGIVVIDEAYIDFSQEESFAKLIARSDNLIVIQTLSKAWGMAGIRLGMAITNEYIVGLLNKIKPPYNVNILSQRAALERLSNEKDYREQLDLIISEKERLSRELARLPMVIKIHPSDANFLLVRFTDADHFYHLLRTKGVVVRNRSRQVACEGCLRLTIGRVEENNKLLEILKT